MPSPPPPPRRRTPPLIGTAGGCRSPGPRQRKPQERQWRPGADGRSAGDGLRRRPAVFEGIVGGTRSATHAPGRSTENRWRLAVFEGIVGAHQTIEQSPSGMIRPANNSCKHSNIVPGRDLPAPAPRRKSLTFLFWERGARKRRLESGMPAHPGAPVARAAPESIDRSDRGEVDTTSLSPARG